MKREREFSFVSEITGNHIYFYVFRNFILFYLILFFVLFNSGNDLACCLWGSYAEQLENHVQRSNLQNNVCLLRFAKINEFRGMVRFLIIYSIFKMLCILALTKFHFSF